MPIQILHLEDEPADAELVVAVLEAEGLQIAATRVATRPSYEAALRQGGYDLILADFALPSYDGLAALAFAQAHAPQIPFIFVTGALGEDQAIETLKSGATDYVYKNRLRRLGPSVRRALAEAAARIERESARSVAQAEREWLRVTLNSIGEAVIATDTAGRVTFMNRVAEALTGWPQGEAVGRPADEIVHLIDEEARAPIASVVAGVLRPSAEAGAHGTARGGVPAGALLVRRDGRNVPIDDSAAPIRDEGGTLLGAVIVFRDITERRQAEAALSETEDRFRILADHAPVMVWMAGPDGGWDFANQPWLDFTGQSPVEVVGQGWAAAVHEDDRARRLITYRESLAARQSFELEYRLRRSDGQYRWVVDKGVPRYAPGGQFAGYIGSAIDIHERRAAEAAVATRAEQQAVVAALGQRALARVSLPELMDEVVEGVASTLGVEYCEILQAQPGAQALRLVAGRGWKPGLVGTATVGAGLGSQAGYTFLADAPVIVSDLRAETRFSPPALLLDHGTVSGVTAVVRGPQRAFGVIGAHTTQRRAFTVDDASFLQSIANVLGEAIARWQAEESLRDLTHQLDRALAEAVLLNDIAGATSGEADLSQILELTLSRLRRVVAFTGGSIALVEGQALVIRAAAGIFAVQSLGQRLTRAASARWKVVDTGEPFLSSDVLEGGPSAATPIRSYLAVPLVWRGETFGLLEVDSTEPQAFSLTDLALMQRLATVLSGSIQMARLNADLEQRVLERTAALRAAIGDLQSEIVERQQAEARFRGLVESAPDAIAVVDRDGRIVVTNAQAGHLFGYPPTDLIGQPAEVLLPERYRQRRAGHRGVFMANTAVNVLGAGLELYGQRRDGSEFPIEISLSPVRTPDGVLVFSAIRDITERKRMDDELRESREELRQLSTHLQAAREEERRRIAREIHDELGGAMTSLKMDISRLARTAGELTPERLRERATAMSELINTTIKTIRRIATELRPALLDDFGLLAALEWQLQEFQERSGLECKLDCAIDELDLDPDRSTAVFRVFQETLTNVARHAQATRVDVSLEQNDHQLVLRVRDNGRGISESALRGGTSLGLVGMRERVHLLAGELDIHGAPGQGTTVLVRIPLEGRLKAEG